MNSVIGDNAFIIAAHVVFLLSGWIAMRYQLLIWFTDGACIAAAERPACRNAVFIVAACLAVERLYYISARFLSTQDVNLWKAHPAPEIMSLLVAFSFFKLALAYSRVLTGRWFAPRLVLEGAFLSVAWVLIGFWLKQGH